MLQIAMGTGCLPTQDDTTTRLPNWKRPPLPKHWELQSLMALVAAGGMDRMGSPRTPMEPRHFSPYLRPGSSTCRRRRKGVAGAHEATTMRPKRVPLHRLSLSRRRLIRGQRGGGRKGRARHRRHRRLESELFTMTMALALSGQTEEEPITIASGNDTIADQDAGLPATTRGNNHYNFTWADRKQLESRG